MFFNYCCKRPCCRCEKNNKQEKNYCDIKDKYYYDKCDKHDKCDYDKQERCCCHINFEKKCCCNKDRDNHFDRKESCYQNEKGFDNKSYYGEYNSLGSFDYNNEYDYEQNSRKYYDKENNRKSCDDYNDFDCKKCYTPNWENDRDCKCEKDNKHDWNNKCCRPVKYICFPWDKY